MGVEICDFRAVLHFCNIVTKTQVLVRRRIRIHDQCQQLAFPLFVELQQIASLFIVTIVIFKFLVLKYVTCELLLFWRKANLWQYTEGEAPIDKLNILQGYDYGYGSKVPKTLWQHSNICQWRAPRNNHLPSQTQNAKQNVVTNISNNISTVFLWILCQLSGSSLEKKIMQWIKIVCRK